MLFHRVTGLLSLNRFPKFKLRPSINTVYHTRQATKPTGKKRMLFPILND